MKYHSLTRLFAISLSALSLLSCATDDNSAFSVNTLQLGTGAGENFTAGEISIVDNTLPNATDNTVIKVHLVDANGLFSTENVQLNFTSACISSGASSISPSSVTNTTGVIQATYTNNTCQGDDDIVVSTNTSPALTATGTVSTGDTGPVVAPPTAGTTLLFGSGPNTSAFSNGVLDIQSSSIIQAGTTTITAKIVDSDNSYLTSTEAHTVTFSSDCVNLTQATLSASTVSNTAGNPAIFQVTYTHVDNACATDNITATTTLSGATTQSASTGVINISATPVTPPASAGTFSLGYGIGSSFSNGALNIPSSSLTSGGSTTITANIVDENQLLDTNNTNTVNFQVQCDNQGDSTLSATSDSNANGIFTTTFTDVSCNGTVTVVAYATLNGTTKTASGSLSIGTVSSSETYSIGELTGSGFVAGQMNLSSTSLNAGESSLITIHITDSGGNLYTTDTPVIFNSTCVGQGTAIIDAGNGTAATTTTTTGTATASYQATGCVGTDTITATASSLNGTTTASSTIAVAAAAFNTIEFVSATPTQIGIQGMGLNETTNVKFKLVDESSGPVSGQTVNFTLSNNAGGITLTNASAISGADGEVTAVVQSGKVQANFVVTASTVVGATTYVASSNTISVQNAIPAQNGLSLVTSSINPEGYNRVTNVSITAYVNDRNNNPVPDGNRVNFLAECGSIGASCETDSGSCTVTWTSTPINCTAYNDSTDLGKVAIMAYIDGEESFLDADADGEFTTGDTILTNNEEAYMDFDNSGAFNPANDEYQDFNDNGSHDSAAGLGTGFNGALCVDNCGSTDRVHVYKSTTLIASTSSANILFCSNNVSDGSACNAATIAKAADTVTTFWISVKDTNGNILPAGTKIAVKASSGTVLTTANFTINNSAPITANQIAAEGISTFAVIYKTGSAGDDGVITIEVETPSGTTTSRAKTLQ